MGRPPCCDKVGVKKGPWTPEEDIILVSYIQEHGPGNWRSVPTNTGLLRCSKSCRLRWTNYLRPGIKRGNFTAHEEGMIIHLQALLGNKWAAIASYLPQRTDNDIKNYWNTHLKKKLKKLHSGLETQVASSDSCISSKSFTSETPLGSGLSQTSSTYASSTENISRLLEGWMRTSPKPDQEEKLLQNERSLTAMTMLNVSHGLRQPKVNQGDTKSISREELDSLLSFQDVASSCVGSWGKEDVMALGIEKHPKLENFTPPLTFLENWLLDEPGATQVEEIMELVPPPVF